jgi:hypothetical protein
MTLTGNFPISPQIGSAVLSPDGSYLIGESYDGAGVIDEYSYGTATFDLIKQTPLVCLGVQFFIGDTLYFYYGRA